MLSKAEQKELTELYLEYQEKYNQTHDQSILWEKLRPLLISMIGNCAKKKCGNHFIDDFDHRVEAQTDRVIKRYIENPQYNRDLPMSLAYWESVNMLYASGHDKLVGNYDNEWDYENASYTEEDKDIKLVDVGGNRIVMDYATKEFTLLKEDKKVEEIIKALEEQGWKKVV